MGGGGGGCELSDLLPRSLTFVLINNFSWYANTAIYHLSQHINTTYLSIIYFFFNITS